MGRRGKPWFRTSRQRWYAEIQGKQVDLGPDKAEAEREWHRLLGQQEPQQAPSSLTWRLIDDYLDWCKPRLAEATWTLYRHYLRSWGATYGRMRASELRPYHVTRWIERASTWGQSTRSIAITSVKVWSAWCEREGYTEVDRLRSVRRPGIRKREPAPPGVLERIIAAAEPQEFRDFLTVLFDTGCRPGELRSLQATDVDYANAVIVVRGKRGKRLVGVTKRSLDILNRLNEALPRGVIFFSRLGSTWNKNALAQCWKRVIQLVNNSGHLVPYHMRHDFWSRAQRAGVDSVTIAKQLGHVDLKMLASRYAHPDAAMLAEAAERAAGGTRVRGRKPSASRAKPRNRRGRS